LALGDHYGQATFDEVCSEYAMETEECGVLAAAKRQPENPSHRSSRPVSEEFLTATEYVFLYLSAQTAAARCTLCDELVVADAKRHVELAPYLRSANDAKRMDLSCRVVAHRRAILYKCRRLPMSSTSTDAPCRAAASKQCRCVHAARHLSTAVEGSL
jgi:hypothetical protein